MIEGREGGDHPTDEEIAKAEDMMTAEEKNASSERQGENEEKSRQRYREQREKVREENVEIIINKASEGLKEAASRSDFDDRSSFEIDLQDRDEKTGGIRQYEVFGYPAMDFQERNQLYAEILRKIAERAGFKVGRSEEALEKFGGDESLAIDYMEGWIIDINGRKFNISLGMGERHLRLSEIKE